MLFTLNRYLLIIQGLVEIVNNDNTFPALSVMNKYTVHKGSFGLIEHQLLLKTGLITVDDEHDNFITFHLTDTGHMLLNQMMTTIAVILREPIYLHFATTGNEPPLDDSGDVDEGYKEPINHYPVAQPERQITHAYSPDLEVITNHCENGRNVKISYLAVSENLVPIKQNALYAPNDGPNVLTLAAKEE